MKRLIGRPETRPPPDPMAYAFPNWLAELRCAGYSLDALPENRRGPVRQGLNQNGIALAPVGAVQRRRR